MAEWAKMEVTVEPDPVPLTLVIAGTIRRALIAGGGRSARVKGAVVLTSSTDAQAVTIRFSGDSIYVERGAAADADVTISADLDTMSEPDAPSPSVTGLARHPRLALAASKVLDPPVGSWREEATRFLEVALVDEVMVRPVRVVCTDDGGELQLGGEGPANMEIHGPARRLANAFSGTTHIVEEVLAEKIQVIGDLRDLSILAGKVFELMFGEQGWTTSV